MRFLAVIVCLLALFGCAVRTVESVGELNTDIKALVERYFDSEELLALVDKVSTTDALLANHYKAESLREQVNLDVLNLFPKGAVELSILDRQFLNRDSFNLVASGFFNLDYSGYFRKIFESQKHLYDAARNDLMWLDRVLKTDVILNYLTVAYFVKYQNILRESCENLEKVASIADSKFKAGLDTKDMAILANLEAKLCAEELLRTGYEVLNASRNLKGIFGYDAEMSFMIAVKTLDFPDLEIDITGALINRPDVRATFEKVQAALRLKEASIRDFLPKLTIKGSMLQAVGSANDISLDSMRGFLELSVLQPLFSLPEKLFQARRLDALAKSAIHESNQTLLLAGSEILWSLQVLDLSAKRLKLLSEGVEEYKKALEISRRRYEEGLTTLVDLLKFESSYLKFATLRNLSELAYAVAIVNVGKSVPTLFAPTG